MGVHHVLIGHRSEHRAQWIQKTPHICGGEACIRDTRVPAWAVVAAQRLGTSNEELLTYFVTLLNPADLQAAFAFYEQHKNEIEEDIRFNQEA